MNPMILVLLFLAWVYSAAPTVKQWPLEPFGVGTHWNESKHWHQLQKAGVEWLRLDISWYHVESNQGTLYYDHIDPAIRLADSLGLKTVVILGYCPPWACRDGQQKGVPLQEMLPQWLNYIESTVRHYRHSVDAWEIWNEPDHHAFFISPNSKTRYEEYRWLQQASIQHLRKVFGNDLIITSSGFALGGSHDPELLPRILKESPDIVNQWNVLSLHGYGYPGHESMRKRIQIAKDARKRYPHLRSWITEHGVTGFKKGNISNENAGDFLVRNIAMALSQGIDKFFWFRLIPGNDYATLLDKQGNPTPFLGLYSTLIQQWKGAESIVPWSGGQGVQGATAHFANGKKVHLLWSESGAKSIKIPNAKQAMSLWGTAMAIQNLTVQSSPLFVSTHD